MLCNLKITSFREDSYAKARDIITVERKKMKTKSWFLHSSRYVVFKKYAPDLRKIILEH